MKQELRDFFVVKEWVDVRKVEIRVKHTKKLFSEKPKKLFKYLLQGAFILPADLCVWFVLRGLLRKVWQTPNQNTIFCHKKYQFKFSVVVWAGLA